MKGFLICNRIIQLRLYSAASEDKAEPRDANLHQKKSAGDEGTSAPASPRARARPRAMSEAGVSLQEKSQRSLRNSDETCGKLLPHCVDPVDPAESGCKGVGDSLELGGGGVPDIEMTPSQMQACSLRRRRRESERSWSTGPERSQRPRALLSARSVISRAEQALDGWAPVEMGGSFEMGVAMERRSPSRSPNESHRVHKPVPRRAQSYHTGLDALAREQQEQRNSPARAVRTAAWKKLIVERMQNLVSQPVAEVEDETGVVDQEFDETGIMRLQLQRPRPRAPVPPNAA